MSSGTPQRPGAWRRFTAFYAWLLSQLLLVSLVILIVPVTLQIFARYTPLVPNYIWTEELARFVFIWTIMLGAIIGVRESAHFDCDVWPEVGGKLDAFGRLLGRLGVLATALVFVWAGIEFTRFGWNRHSELGDLPLWTIHLAWPVAGLSWIVFLGEQVVNDLRVITGAIPAPPRRGPAGEPL
ncbi:MAG TPA: TRAP transporter small permease [Ramlibacter sp.]|nr:TRAP transporter small permease [Ramlibacter sp.]